MEITRRQWIASGASLAALPYLAAEVSADTAPAAKMPEGGIVILAQLQVKEGKEDGAREVLLALVGPTRKEAGCLCYNLHQATDDKTKFMFYEQWASAEALKAHGQSPHMQAFRGKIKDLKEPGFGGATRFDLVE
jgi:quinol monooxygenase YgiN